MNQRKKGYQPTHFQNETKRFPRKYFHSNNQNTQGGGKPVNLGAKEVWGQPQRTVKMLGMWRTSLKEELSTFNLYNRTTVHNL
jgi:hypothetical protein